MLIRTTTTLGAWCLLGAVALAGTSAWANPQDGTSLLGMCNGADKVRSLAVMCHSYTNGYIEAANYYTVKQHGKPVFCVDEKRKKMIPLLIASRIKADPELKHQPATAILHTVLSQNFACK